MIEAENENIRTEEKNRELLEAVEEKEIKKVKEDEEITEGVILFPMHIPLIKKRVIKDIIEKAEEEIEEVEEKKRMLISPTYKGKRGGPLYIPANFFKEIIKYKEFDGMKEFIRENLLNTKIIEVTDERILVEVVTQEDYYNLVEFIKKRGRKKELKDLFKNRRFFLIKHGSIAPTKNEIFLGRVDLPMSSIGTQEIINAAWILKGYEFRTEKLYSSPLCRARRSAEILKEEVGFKEIVDVDELQEIAHGDWDGQTMKQIKKKYPDEYKLRGENILTFKPPGKSENFYDMRYRVESGLKKILEEDKSKDIIIVSHFGIIKIVEEFLNNRDLLDNLETEEELDVRTTENAAIETEAQEEIIETEEDSKGKTEPFVCEQFIIVDLENRPEDEEEEEDE